MITLSNINIRNEIRYGKNTEESANERLLKIGYNLIESLPRARCFTFFLKQCTILQCYN